MHNYLNPFFNLSIFVLAQMYFTKQLSNLKTNFILGTNLGTQICQTNHFTSLQPSYLIIVLKFNRKNTYMKKIIKYNKKKCELLKTS